ncbi:MAG: hypothetical protein AB7V56_06460 [Candidatus Nitrosocosmicus sp.]
MSLLNDEYTEELYYIIIHITEQNRPRKSSQPRINIHYATSPHHVTWINNTHAVTSTRQLGPNDVTSDSPKNIGPVYGSIIQRRINLVKMPILIPILVAGIGIISAVAPSIVDHLIDQINKKSNAIIRILPYESDFNQRARVIISNTGTVSSNNVSLSIFAEIF